MTIVKAKYRRANSMTWFNRSSSSSQLFVEAFHGTDISDSNWDKKISESLIKTNEQLQNIDKAIKKLGSGESKNLLTSTDPTHKLPLALFLLVETCILC